jgi:hypothetical protein
LPGPFYWAWAGGLIEEQITLVTTGNTHGGVLETVGFVADVDGQIMRLAAPDKLTDGEYYALTGPGLAAGTVAIPDATISPPGSINIAPAGSTARSATYTATKAVPIGTVLATFDGSDQVFIDGAELTDGAVYSIAGTAIGDAGEFPVQTAFLTWDAASGSGLMWTLVATKLVDDVNAYTIESRPVTATDAGDFPAVLGGMPSGDWYSITGIPSAALSSLVAGLSYNISGNGIPVGTTFVAPASGATSLTIDQPASSAEIGAILTITGPRTPNAPFDPALHARFDEDVITVEITQSEGDFATLTVGLKNPGVGLLAAGRNLWCWLSWDQAWTPEGGAAPDLVPLFNGRLVGIPRLAAGELVELQFLARPDDFNSQKAALAASLQVLPYWDPVWLAANISADTVLETYSALWHIDRTTLALSISDIIQGEDGTVTIGEDVAFYDNFSLSYGEPPLVATTVSGTVSWSQQGQGIIDVTPKLVQAFDAVAAAPYGVLPYALQKTYPNWLRTGGSGMIQALYGDGLLNDWPKPGTTIGGGWSLSNLADASGKPLCFIEEATQNNKNGWLTPRYYNLNYTWPSWRYAGLNRVSTEPEKPPSDSEVVLGEGLTRVVLSFPLQTYNIRMHVEYKANRPRTETVTAVLTADVQRVLSDSADSDRENIELSSEFVGQGVDPGGGVPIGDLAYKSYFQTDRGTASFEYMLLAARAKMRARARSVEVTLGTDWRTALDIGLRHSITLLDRRLPGGNATGKVKSYTLRAADGVMTGEFTIACTIGNGTPSVAALGENTYVDDPYVERGWQVVAGAQYPLFEDEFAYEGLDSFVVADDGINLSFFGADEAVNYCTVDDGLEQQLTALDQYQDIIASKAAGDPLTKARELTTTVTLDLRPVQGSEFHTNFFPALTQLSLPKTIDLAAE